MKLFYLLLLFVSSTASAVYGQKVTPPADVIKLIQTSYDFGKIPQGRPVTHNFEVINQSKVPLSIDNVQASCGCTTPEWSPEPIAPGAKAVIKVGFNAASEGKFSKSITIFYNGEQTKSVVISGEVYPAPTTSAPLNPSLSKLKQ